jgi:serine/threonine-protein kinase HipA
MALHLVGETIDKHRANYGVETGKLIQLMRGIYVDVADDVDATVLKHAVRISRYLYPHTYLSAASATLLAPSRHGRVYISGRRIQRTRIRALEIIQNQAPEHPALDTAIVDDGLGEFRVDVSSIRQRFLEAFRLRSEHAASVDEGMRESLSRRLVEEYGGPKEAADAVWTLARQNEWYREGEGAERYLRRPEAVGIPIRNEAALDLIVAWHGAPLGHLIHDGFEWRWNPSERQGPPLIRQTTPGKLPPFIVSLLPEGWLERVLNDADERTLLKSGKRYMSNITVVENAAELNQLPQDILITRLAQFSRDGVFTGEYLGYGRSEIEENFERNLAKIYERADTPRLSGVQIKAPMYLDDKGRLSTATGLPFTHILKPAGTSGFDALPLVEWIAMELGRAAGLEAPATALIPMPDKMPPALLVERFDIRLSNTDTRMLALEDMCSVLDLPTSAKYDGTMERVARAVRPLSTSPEDDLLIIVKRALFAWLIADGDMHLKNMALLKIAEPGDAKFRSVRMAPLYDAVTTRVFPKLKHDRLALKLSGRDNNLRRADFITLATTAGLRAGNAETAIEDIVQRLRKAVDGIAVPKTIEVSDATRKMTEEVLDICRRRVKAMA